MAEVTPEAETPAPKPKAYRGGPRKKSPRTKGLRKISAASKRLKELWADPEWRAQMMEKRKAEGERKKREGVKPRLGIPDGMRRPEAEKVWAEAETSAKKTVEAMDKNGVFDKDEDAGRAKEALEFNITVMRGKHDIRARLQAASKVLEYTKIKPVAKSEMTINKAEEWLAMVSKEDESDGRTEDEATGDA